MEYDTDSDDIYFAETPEQMSRDSILEEDIRNYLRRKTDTEMQLIVGRQGILIPKRSIRETPLVLPFKKAEVRIQQAKRLMVEKKKTQLKAELKAIKCNLHISKKTRLNKSRLPASAYPHLQLVQGGKYICKCGKHVWPPNRDKHRCIHSVILRDMTEK